MEADLSCSQTEPISHDFTGIELPHIIEEIVDDLQPLLTPYQATFYWFAFRNSVIRTGDPYIRIGQRGLKNIVKTNRGQSGSISQSHIKETLSGLETLGVIRREGEPNRDGTLYRVLIPDEIPACREHRASRSAIADSPTTVDNSEIDYYNVRENRIKIYERDNYICHYCGKQLTQFTATLDHVHAVVKGGNNSFENLITACLLCNSRKNKRAVGDFLAEV